MIPVGGESAIRYLPQQLEALTRQVSAPTFEVILADNGCGGVLEDVAAAFQNQLDVHVIDASEKRGASHARNCEVASARAERLLFCDADDIVSPTWVRGLSLLVEPGTAATTYLVPFTGDPQADSLLESFDFYSSSRSRHFLPVPPPLLWKDSKTYLLTGGTFGMSREDYVRLQGMDESFPHGAEDLDFAARFVEGGGTVELTRSAHIFYRLPSSRATHLRKLFYYAVGDVLRSRREGDRNNSLPGGAYGWRNSFYELREVFAADSLDQSLDLLARAAGRFTGKVQIRLLHRIPEPAFYDYENPASAEGTSH
nr:glycosyltransferase family A protein [Actinomyces sp.]